MVVLKHKGKVYGANLTATERRAMEIEIKRQLAEWDRGHEIEMVATTLWVLMTRFGFGEKRLKRFFDGYDEAIRELIDYYQLADEDAPWLCTQKLKDKGIDIEKWAK